MTTPLPLGKGLLGQARYGDEAMVSLVPRSQAVAVTYTVALSQHASALAISYIAQRDHTAPILVYYQVGPLVGFAINATPLAVAPDQVIPTPRAVMARTLIAQPILQGYPMISFLYSVIEWPAYQQIAQVYNPQNTIVVLTYPDDTGIWVQRKAVMHPPDYGTQTTVLVNQATFSFSLLS